MSLQQLEPRFVQVSRTSERVLLLEDLRDAGLTADELWQQGEPLPGAMGRGGVSVLRPRPDLALVARDYRRGGALGSLFSASYLDPQRPMRELRLLAKLSAMGVPVVEPVAALARRRGMSPFWRLRLVTRLFEGATPLPRFVQDHENLRPKAIDGAGRVIGQAFAAGLLHHDLHPDNLLVGARKDAVEVRLLDLDRCQIQDLQRHHEDRMLLRMARYLTKHAGRMPRWSARDEVRFLRGMGLSAAERRSRLGDLVPALKKELRRHWLTGH